MKVSVSSYVNNRFNNSEKSDQLNCEKVQLVLGFGAKNLIGGKNIYDTLHQQYPIADIVLCSTSGEIFDNKVVDHSVSVTAIEFEKTIIKTTIVNIDDHDNNSFRAGLALVKNLELTADLCYIMILADGGKVNGSELVNGINEHIQNKVPVTGGLAGDGTAFLSTLVGLNEDPSPGKIIAIGFYSSNLEVAHGSMGGWEMFGPERIVTRSAANELFEINGENALDVYKKYLGPYADDLPGSALLFPLSVKLSPAGEPVVRTILSINNDSSSMVFAGDVPEGSQVRLMKANFDKLIDAASEAANQTFKSGLAPGPKLALLISCVGRKMILDTRIEEEVEAVQEVFGENTLLTGFYSYGEISPFSINTKCALHNQTMTITTFNES
ncbi:MAG: FIST N-terminal domain-containing protein [Ferruginibacter sp.]